MNRTQKRLSAAAWSLLEVLSRLRRSVQQELGFLQSVSPELPTGQLDDLLIAIDDFTSDTSSFLTRLSQMEEEEMEEHYQLLANRFEVLQERVEGALGR